MTLAIPTLHPVTLHDTILHHPHGMPDLYRSLDLTSDRTDSARGTDLGTFRTFRPTVAAVIFHFGLHEARPMIGRTKHMVRTGRYTELACGTLTREMACADRSRRGELRHTVGKDLVFNLRKSSVDLLVLRLHGRSEYDRSRSREKMTA